MSTELQPVARGERLELLDALRGFALLGILMVNFWGPPGTAMPALDAFIGDVLGALVDSSIYPLYSFLFGLGFALQLERAQRRGRPTAHLYLRRMIVLFLIGTVHALFIWEGDILVTYALTGLLLIPLHKLSQRGVLALVFVLALLNLNRDSVRETVNDWRYGDRDESQQLVAEADQEESRIILNQRMLA